MLATVYSIALQGAVGHVVAVQADVSTGTPGTTVVGRADAMLNEGRDRARMAVQNSEKAWPVSHRVTVLLSPADLPKIGTHYDLAIAVSVLAASGEVTLTGWERLALIGELSLDGGLRPIAGVLPMVLAAARHGIRRVIVPEPQVAEAALVPGVEVFGLRSLGQVIALLEGTQMPEASPVQAAAGGGFLGWRGQDRLCDADMSDLRGLADAKFAVEVAAAGGHHVHLTGSKGCGKTSLAERIAGILPDLDSDVALELMALRSLTGRFDLRDALAARPPYSAPHHDASKAALVGGGSGKVVPGALSLAHGGVVFLDEFALFRTDVIDALRDPMENGEISIARADEKVTLPARSLIVLASNPCPCGNDGNPRAICSCRAAEKRDYQRRVRGPILDRIDITRQMSAFVPGAGDDTRTTAQMRSAVEQARERQAARYRGTMWRLNSEVTGVALREQWPLSPAAERALAQTEASGSLTHRGSVRLRRVAWTVADLLKRAQPGERELETALALRDSRPLPVALLRSRLEVVR